MARTVPLRNIAAVHGLARDGDAFIGLVSGHRVRLEADRSHLWVELAPSIPFSPHLCIWRRAPGRHEPPPMLGSVTEVEILTGHREFDDLVRLSTRKEHLTETLAALDFETRDKIYLAVQIGAVLSEGKLCATVTVPSHQESAVAILVAMADTLGRVSDPVERLMEIARGDPIPSASQAAIEHLLRVTTIEPSRLGTLVYDKTVPGLTRFIAARALPAPDSRSALLALISERTRWGALAASVLSCDTLAPWFDEDLPLLEPALLASLGPLTEPPVFEALARVGSPACVTPLAALARSHPAMRRDVEQAIAAVRLRHGGETGALSLCGAETSGRLSVSNKSPSS